MAADPEAVVRASAAEALADLPHESRVAALLGALGDEDEAVRAYAAYSLGLVAESDGAEADLASRLEGLQVGQAAVVQVELVVARYRLGSTGAFDELVTLIDQTGEEIVAVQTVNAVRSLVDRARPATLAAHADRLSRSLADLAARCPLVAGGVAPILEKLRP
jgi:HEAT repeat protein